MRTHGADIGNFELSNCQQENYELKARVRLLEEQLAIANAVAQSDELAIVNRHREEVRQVNDQFVKKPMEIPNQYPSSNQNFIGESVQTTLGFPHSLQVLNAIE